MQRGNENNRWAILVNTSDGYSDCWEPFFRLFVQQWPHYSGHIYLNTERKSFSWPPLDIRCLKTSEGLTHSSWSDCLARALAHIHEEIILYLQEDYFLESGVDEHLIDELAAEMSRNPSIDCIHLTHAGPKHLDSPCNLVGLDGARRFSSYKISMQAAMWRRSSLMKTLVPGESAWMFEILGTAREWRRNNLRVCAIPPTVPAPIRYPFTGVMKGRWNKEVRALFDHNGITVDYSRRGFYEPESRVRSRAKTVLYLSRHPLKVVRGILS